MFQEYSLLNVSCVIFNYDFEKEVPNDSATKLTELSPIGSQAKHSGPLYEKKIYVHYFNLK